MNIMEKERLARRHDDSVDACAIRLKAARMTTNKTQGIAASEAGIRPTAWNNAERGRNYPPLQALRWLYRAARIDYNFTLAGEFSQLPADVQEAIFSALEKLAAECEQDQTAN